MSSDPHADAVALGDWEHARPEGGLWWGGAFVASQEFPALDKQVVHVKGKHFTALANSVDMREFDKALAILGIELVIDDLTARGAATEALSPEMREVPAKEAREGDSVTICGTRGHYRQMPDRGLIPGDLNCAGANGEAFHLFDTTVTVTRPAAPLPDKPGAVGVATVRTEKDIRIVRDVRVAFRGSSGGTLAWLALTGPLAGQFFQAGMLSDYQPLLDGQDE